jgi:hypothetical protein
MTLDRFERKKEVQSKDWFYEAITDGDTRNPNSATLNSLVQISNT